MKKLISIFLLCALFINVQAQFVEITHSGNLCGFKINDSKGNLIKEVAPQYEELRFYVSIRMGGVALGENYHSSAYWNDTEYVEVPVDPNDLSKVKVETIINTTRVLIGNQLVMAKKGGKWGLIDLGGQEIVPCQNDEIWVFKSRMQKPFDAEAYPHLVLFKGKEKQLVTQKGKVVLAPTDFPPYFANLSYDRSMDVLEMTFFGENMLINNGGILVDSVVKMPAVKKTEKGKTTIVSETYTIQKFYFYGGTFSVLNLTTQTKLFPEGQKNIAVHFSDEAERDYFEPLNPRSFSSIQKFQENNSLGLTPYQISFKPIP